MGNPIMALLGGVGTAMRTISQLFTMVRMARDPMGEVQKLAQTDERMQEVMKVVDQNGGNAKAAFYNMAQQKGKDPNEILEQLRSMMK